MRHWRRLSIAVVSFGLTPVISGCTLQPNGSLTLTGFGPSIAPTPSNGCYASNYTPSSGTLAAAIAACHARTTAMENEARQEEEHQRKQQEALAARAAARRAKEIKNASNHPTLGMREFEREMSPDVLAIRYGSLARSCGLRTEQWYRVIQFSYDNDFRREEEKIPLTSIQEKAVENNLRSLEYAGATEDCKTFSTSSQLSALDSFVSQVKENQRNEILNEMLYTPLIP